MKSCVRAVLAFAAVAAPAAATRDDRAVTKVVKLLEGMMVKSKEDGDKDREVYAKFKCYCDTQTATKTKEIAGLDTNIARLESSIEKLKGSTGELSSECSQLRADMMTNEQARESAQSIRDKEHENFVAEEADLVAAIDQMKLAIETLSEVGADQTLEGAAADHKMAMGGFGGAFMQKRDLGKLGARVKEALAAASGFMDTTQKSKVASFIQAPFTGTYSAVSGEVVGILKNMRDTFTENLSTARATEKAQLEAHEKFMAIKEEAYNKMSGLYDEKQSELGNNDDNLAADQQLLAEDKEQKDIKEQFLAELEPLCAERKKEYEKRVALRANEDAAISEALAILNSDAAFASFGKTDATSVGKTGASFLQLASVSRHVPDAVRQQVQVLLRKAAGKQGSLRLAQVVSSLEAENPFDVVLKEIEKMIVVTEEEGKVDKEKLDWCRDERKKNNDLLDEKKSQIAELETQINELENTINEPEVGLKDSIAKDEASLAENSDSQLQATKQRQDENALYQTDISNLVTAEDLLARAVKILDAYYASIEEHVAASEETREAVVLSGEEEAAPTSGGPGFGGQAGQGNKVIEMINFILEETKKEETVAHEDEQAAQSDYETLLTGLKEEEVRLKESIANLKATLAEKEKELMEAENLLKETEKEKASIEAYLESIKAGCDFMEDNFDLRETRRASETSALEEAASLLKGSPAYKAWESADHLESLGECKDKCVESGEEHVVCKACLAKVEIPGYCAGHPDTEGC